MSAAPGVVLPELSLVVCTRDRASRLPGTLRALSSIRSAHPWELVLVDNASSDGTAELLAQFVTESPVFTLLVHEHRPGLASARNAGVAASRAPLVAFTDDDCYPAPDFVDRWIDVFRDTEVAYGSGRIELHDPDDAPVTIRTDDDVWPFRPGSYVRPGVIQGANLALRRSVLAEIGGFDPALGPGALFNCEDVDVAARASLAGHAGGYFPGPTVRHHHGRRPGPELDSLLASYDHGRGAYWASLLLRSGARHHGARNLLISVVRKPPHVLRRELSGAWEYLMYRREAARNGATGAAAGIHPGRDA